MARILKRKNKKGWSYTITIRIKGYPSISRTFGTKGEAAAWAAKTEERIKLNKYNDPRQAMDISLGQALEKYLNTISQKKAINTHMREKVAAKRLMEQIGTEMPLGSISPATAATYRDARLEVVSAYLFAKNLLFYHISSQKQKKNGVSPLKTLWPKSSVLRRQKDGHDS